MSWDRLALDLRQAARALRRARGLSVAVVLTLGLALAASIAAVAVLDATLVAALPYREPDRVVTLRHTQTAFPVACSVPTFLDYRRDARSFASLAATRPADLNLAGDGDPERVRGLFVSPGFFDTMGVAAASGRTFDAAEEEPGPERVLVISDALWHRRFGGAPDTIGRTLRLDGVPYAIVGILPRGFEWGRAYGREAAADVWAPLVLTAAETAEDARGNENLDVYARLAPGASIGTAQAELDTIVTRLRDRHPGRYTIASGFRVTAVPLQDDRVGGLRQGLALIALAVGALLLAAAVNVAGLLLARAASRRRETAVRAALGASRARLAREVLVEAVALAGVAGALGVGLAAALCAALETIDRTMLPRAHPIAVSPLAGAFAVVATLAVAIVSGLLPARHAWRGDISGRSRNALGASRSRRVLIVAQTALAATLLLGAGLLVRSLAELQRVRPGFRTEDVLTARVRLPRADYADRTRRVRLVDDALARVTATPRVISAAVISEAPLGGSGNSGTFGIDGHPIAEDADQPHAQLWSASARYFETMGIPLRSGRPFDGRDMAVAPAVAIVSESLARRYFPDGTAVGARIDFEGEPGAPRWREVVGVVGDVRDRRLDSEPTPQLYVPYAQRPTLGHAYVVRTVGDPRTAAPILREAVRAGDAALPLFDVATMVRLADDTTRERRAARTALAAFAAAALALSALGLYALLAQTVRERVPEIGLRMAIGAGRAQVVRMVLASGGRLVIAGLAVGAVLGLAAARLLRGYLFGVTATDPPTVLAVVAVLLAAGLGACALPAWRASRVDPLSALRAD